MAMKRGSISTSSRPRSYVGKYRTLAPTSRVDETLFGAPKPQQVPKRESLILKRAEFEAIASAAQLPNKYKGRALTQASEREKEERKKAAEEIKRQIIEAGLSRNNNNYVLTEQDLEAKERAKHLMERADALRMEQEDEVKKLNQLILGAQCQAIRDKQIQEKKQIQDELAMEEKRLDTLMEVERCKALDMTEKIDKLRRDQRMRGMQDICHQIQRRQEEKLCDDEMKEIEKTQIRENQERMILEDLKALEKKRREQQLLQEEIMRINNETLQAKEKRIEQERLADLRAMEYMKKKLEREAEYEKEQMRIKKEKELEIARLRAQQEREKDYKAEQDEIRARRNQDVAEREWRVKEKEAATKKAREEALLKAARLEQVKNKEHVQSIAVGQERAVYERVFKAQREAAVKEMEQEEKRRQKAQLHAQAIRQQIRERELSAVAQRREFFQEADRLTEEARQRRVRLDKFKEKKLQELKATGISEKYCTEVERKAQKTHLD